MRYQKLGGGQKRFFLFLNSSQLYRKIAESYCLCYRLSVQFYIIIVIIIVISGRDLLISRDCG